MAVQLPKLIAPPGYRPQAEDCSLEADLLQFYWLRQYTPSQRLAIAASLMRNARQFSLNCFRRRFGHLSSQQFARKIAEAWLQEYCPPDYIPTGSEMTWVQDSIELAAELHVLLQEVGIPYYITGGVAAIAYGESRTTQDLDIVISISSHEIGRLVTALEKSGFYVPGVEDIITGRLKILQITQQATISRADLIIAGEDEYEKLQFVRRQAYPLREGTAIELASAEDLIVNKLRWGQRSQSEKQWRDVLGILKAQQEALEFEYLYQWASHFGLENELEKAITEAGVREFAAQQWAKALFPLVVRAFEIAQQKNRTSIVREGIEVATGKAYLLVKDALRQEFAVYRREDSRQITQFDGQGNVKAAHPELSDRQQWRVINEQLNSIDS